MMDVDIVHGRSKNSASLRTANVISREAPRFFFLPSNPGGPDSDLYRNSIHVNVGPIGCVPVYPMNNGSIFFVLFCISNS